MYFVTSRKDLLNSLNEFTLTVYLSSSFFESGKLLIKLHLPKDSLNYRQDEITQFIIRMKDGSAGYETVFSSTGNDIDEDLLPHLLPKFAVKTGQSYYYKITLNDRFTLLKLVVGDGLDKYGRTKGKINILIIPNKLYEKNGGILYYANPLWNGSISLKEDFPLTATHFSKLEDDQNTFKPNIELSAILLQLILLYDHVIISFKGGDPSKDTLVFLSRSLGYIDSCLPKFFREKVAIKTMSVKARYNLANVSIIPDEEIPPSEINEKTYVFVYNNYKTTFKYYKIFPFVQKLTIATSKEVREKIGMNIKNYSDSIKNELDPHDYQKIANRFGLKHKIQKFGFTLSQKNKN